MAAAKEIREKKRLESVIMTMQKKEKIRVPVPEMNRFAGNPIQIMPRIMISTA
jgi:hypothetical protein